MQPKERGLSNKEAKKLLKEYGYNEIKKVKKISGFSIFFSQFKSPLILILVIAAIISLSLGFIPGTEAHTLDTILILSIVVLTSVFGFLQEYKAEKSIEALRKLAARKAIVFRNGFEQEIDATEIVPGDLLLLKEGNIIPADAIIEESFNLQVNESIFTGESVAVNKEVGKKIFMETYITAGIAKAAVTTTGMHTEIGKIAKKMQQLEKEKTPFQLELRSLSKKLLFIILAITIITAFVLITKFSIVQSLLTSISLAVAAIPEGLPAVVTLTLALAAVRISKKKALARKLSVIESLSAVDIICTDKTGTLTENKMRPVEIFTDKIIDSNKINSRSFPGKEMLLSMALCNNVKKLKTNYVGDQTEVALAEFAESKGFIKLNLEKNYKKVAEKAFSSERKMMSSLFEFRGRNFVFSKGAPEVIIKKCSKFQNKKFTPELRKKIMNVNKKFAGQALRVLAIAYKEVKNTNVNFEKDLTLLGLIALEDPPRKEVRQAIKSCREAGIRVMMITGDHALTARSIAEQVGLNITDVLNGDQIKKLDDKQLNEKLKKINIFARIDPFEKLRILQLLKKQKYRVAMTGDGINDALALKKADVGISMGSKGSEVAREASDLVLLNDNFASIPKAIKQGRGVHDNIKKFVTFLLSCNLAEVAIIFITSLFGYLPLSAIHILWINLVTDGLPAIALGFDPPGKNVMKRKPGERKIMNKKIIIDMIIISGVLTIMLLFSFFFFLKWKGIEMASAIVFSGLVIYQMTKIGSLRYRWKMGIFSNKWLLFAIIASISLQLIVIYLGTSLFRLVPLGWVEWVFLISVSIIGFLITILLIKLFAKKDH